MSGINKVILVGNLGKNPEVRTFENGAKKANFTLATSETRKDKDGNRSEFTEWHNIVCWRNLAEIAEKYLTKGKQIYLEGKLRTRSWDENGTKRYITEIEATTFTMLGAKNDNAEQKVPNATAGVVPPTPPENTYTEAEATTETDDLPF
ncbi:MAG: single-stranded DNA-binding protein [Bacteroidales bacterium]|nr:single-stranded DNA-binding protein [Bacteroidales bacterium]